MISSTLAKNVFLVSCILAGSHALPSPSSSSNTFSKRIPFWNLKDAGNNSVFDFQNLGGNMLYAANITLLGKEFIVQLDTGSSDLWLDTKDLDVSSLPDTGFRTGIVYGDTTEADGPVLIGNFSFGDYNISQAFISASHTNATDDGDSGLLGLGPPMASAVNQTLQNSTTYSGYPLLISLFESNKSLPSLITFQLSRSEANSATDGGFFTIGEAEPSLAAVQQEPKLDVVGVGLFWSVFMDGMVVNGKEISGFSNLTLSGQTSNQTVTVIDSGTSAAQIPRPYLDAIYGDIPGAEFEESLNGYVVPCDANVNVSFVFGGVEYPVHPIDTVVATTDSKNHVFCYSGFNANPGSNYFDFILGDTFMRNVYSLFNYGSYVPGITDSPYLQLLNTTNAEQAYAEFESLSAQRNSSLTAEGASNGASSAALVPRGVSVMTPLLLALTAFVSAAIF